MLKIVIYATALMLAGVTIVSFASENDTSVKTAATAPGTQSLDDAGQVILDENCYWRRFIMRLPRSVAAVNFRQSEGANRPAEDLQNGYDTERATDSSISTEEVIAGHSPPPPPGWRNRDFDDGYWPLRQSIAPSGRPECALLCVRGKFQVNDPARIHKLLLRLNFTGGVVVYLNGKEVARESMPPGPIDPETPGLKSPETSIAIAALRRKGEAAADWLKRREAEAANQLARGRVEIELRSDVLVRGANVLAVEAHSWNYRAAKDHNARRGQGALALQELRLGASADDGAVESALHRPAGISIWNRDIGDFISPFDLPQAGELVHAIQMIGPRNGICSGQIVVGSDQPIKGLSARLSDLSAEGASARLSSSMGEVRFGEMAPDGARRPRGVNPNQNWFLLYGGLADVAPSIVEVQTSPHIAGSPGHGGALEPAPGAVIPICLTLFIPKDTGAGFYRGTLTVSADGAAPFQVPVELQVASWTAPDPKDFVSQTSIYQSPDTLAAWYGVPLWSARHWDLIERSLKYMAQAGNHTIILPLLSKEQIGNEESFVYWLRQSDGSYKYDLSVLNRYLDAAIKTHDPSRIEAVCLVVWGSQGAQYGVGSRPPDGGTVTMIDHGVKSDLKVPQPDSPEYEAFWRPVLQQVVEAVRAHGLADRICLGMPGDVVPKPPDVACFHDILPNAAWFVGSHTGARAFSYDPKNPAATQPVGHVEMTYTSVLPDPAKKQFRGWKRQPMVLGFNRYGFEPMMLSPGAQDEESGFEFRLLMECDLAANYRGVGRIGADFWAMNPMKREGGVDWSLGTFYCRYPNSSVNQIGVQNSCPHLLAPGPDGPAPSIIWFNFREGIQTAEALIQIEQALDGKRISGDLENRCETMVIERVNACRAHLVDDMSMQDWRDRDRRLFALAGELAAASR